ncbi:M28 family metallopeptidase [soil metagenome]
MIAKPSKSSPAVALVVLALLCSPAQAQRPPRTDPAPLTVEQQRNVERLRAAALASDHGYDIVEDLVTRIGPRRAGSPQEAQARDWAVAMLRADGFADVHVEDFTVPTWEATRQEAAVVTPVGPRPLVIAALGGSASTPTGGLEADVVRFANLTALQAADDKIVLGRIVYIDEPMARTQDGSGYGVAVAKRGGCAAPAQAKGAVACLIRSVGTNQDRYAHQGGSPRQAAGVRLPVAALSPADSTVLTGLMARGPVRVRLDIDARTTDDAPSGNVIADVRGRERPAEIVLAAAHLDSWNLGHGAIDDGAGVAIVTAAARLVAQLPQRPRRTIRVFLAGSEEIGGNGGVAYGRAHANDQHVLAAESDFGADSVWRVRTRFGAGRESYAAALQAALAPLSIVPGIERAGGGTDIHPLQQAGVPIVDLDQDGTRYFDVHHTADDTLHMIDRAQLRQNIAAWAVMLYLAADTDWDFRAAP